MKEVTVHHVEGAETNVVVKAVGVVGAGGGHTHYQITGFDTALNTANADDDGYRASFSKLSLIFQNERPMPDKDLVGITMESLMAVCIDRLTDFQAGPFASAENAEALYHLQHSMAALQARTQRMVDLDRANNPDIR
jgi:hypothetical protein